MKSRYSLALGILAAIGLSTAVAHADPNVVLIFPGIASEIDNLVVDGTTYDVTFTSTAVDQTFNGNATGAQDAANAILAALNASTAGNINSGGISGFDTNALKITSSGPLLTDNFATVGGWVQGGTGGGPAFADFTPVSAPEPATLALLGAGIVGLGAARRRQRK
jgi:PEP-CTERM motif